MDELEEHPGSQPGWDDELAALFQSADDVLRELQAYWYRMLVVRLEPYADRGATVDEAVREWHDLAAEHPGLHALLEHEAANPALADLCRQQEFALACAVGLAVPGGDAQAGASAWQQALQTVSRQTPSRPRRWWPSWRQAWGRHRATA